MRHLKLFFVACLTLFSLGFITHTYADEIPTTAPPTGIYDPHHYLNDSVTQKLVGINSIYQQTKLKPQLGIIIVPNIHGYSHDNLEDTATKHLSKSKRKTKKLTPNVLKNLMTAWKVLLLV